MKNLKNARTVALVAVLLLLLFAVLIVVLVDNRHGSSSGTNPITNPPGNPAHTLPGNGDLYYDQNGCLQSHSGAIHPEYCISNP